MADVNANIGIHIDTSQSLAEIKALQRQLAQLYTSINKGSAAAAAAQKGLATNLMNTINAGGKFYAQMGTIRTSTESFTHALEKNKLTMREYFRFAGGSTRTFGRLFKSEFDTIGRVAEERVKKMQTQYVKLGRDASGAMKAISITPTALNMKDYGNQVAVAAQKQALLNQLLKQGSTNLLNFGKNTQWAGRQLMVGFTIPLAYFGTAAAKTFMDLEAQAIKFKRVYGDMFTTTDQTNKALADVQKLAEEFTKYGVAVAKTMEMAASAAAMGKTGAELTAQVAQATRLAVLGNVEQDQALQTTISLTNAFGLAAEDLTSKINFLNAVENQTVTAIEDLTIAIPKAGPVVKQLGGSVEDLAFFLTAMREGGINASEGANALKSGLASLINPTKKAREMLSGMGVDINAIVEQNKGNLKEIVIDFAQALDTLAPLERSRAIEQLFGKFQFARLSTLFENVTKEGTQAARVLDLAGKSVEELAILSERELKTVEDAIGTNFRAAVEELKLAIAPIGKEFLKVITPVIKFFGDLFEKFNNLSDGSKKFIVVLTALIGLVGPTLLMTFGLLANGAANIIKLFVLMRQGFLKLTGNSTNLAQQTQYLNSEQMEAAVVAASLNQAHTKLTQQFTLETSAVNNLRNAYISATAAASRFAATNPGMMLPGFKGIKGGGTKGFATGTTEVVGGQSGKDSVPALLMPGEAVIPTKTAQDDRFKPLVQALVSGEIQKFGEGTDEVTKSKRKAIKKRFRSLYGKDATTRQSYARNAANLDKLVDRLTYDSATKTYTYTTKNGQVFPGISESKVFEKANYVFGKVKSQKGDFISEAKYGTPSNLERQLKRAAGEAGTGAPYPVRKVAKEGNIKFAGMGIDRETATLVDKLKKSGYSDKDIKHFTQTHLSHILEPKDINKKWITGQVLPDFQGLNQYIRGAGGNDVLKLIQDKRVMLPTSQGGLGMSSRQVQLLLRDWAWAGNQKHPTNEFEFRRYARLAAFQEAAGNAGMKVKNIKLVKGINALSAVRDPSFYKNVNERIIQLGEKARLGVDKGKIDKLTKEIMRGAVVKGRETFAVLANAKESIENTITGKTRPVKGTRVNPSEITTPTGNRKDNILTTLKRGERIVRTAAAIRTGGKLILPGAEAAPISTTLGLKSGGAPGVTTPTLSQNTQRLNNQIVETTENTKTLSQKFATGANVFSGLTVAGSFMSGKVGEVSQKLMPFAIGLSTIAMLLPGLKSGFKKLGTFLVAHPWAMVIAGLIALAGSIKLMQRDIDKKAKAESDYIDAVSATTEKMKKVGQITGKVGASEIMARRRESGTANTFTTGFDRAGQQFGTSFLESDIGKQVYESFKTNVAKGGSDAVKRIALELSAYVSDGIMTGEDANSVARSIGINMSDMTITSNIQGELRSLIGPDGQNLLTDPLNIRINIGKEQTKIAGEALKSLQGAGNIQLQTQLGASVAASYTQSLEIIQAQRDAQAKMYDDQIGILEAQLKTTKDKEKQAKIEGQIKDLVDNKNKDDEKFGIQKQDLIKQQLAAFKYTESKGGFLQLNQTQNAFMKATKEQVRAKYKGTEQEAFVNEFLTKSAETGGTKTSKLEVVLNTMVGGGDLTPLAATKLLEMFGKEKEAELETLLTTTLATKDPGKVQELINLSTSIKGKGAKKIGLEVLAGISAEGQEGKFDDRLSALAMLQKMDGKEINLAMFLKGDAIGKLDELVPLLNKVEKQKGPIDIEVIQSLQKTEGMPDLQGLVDDWEHYKNLPDEIKKTAIQTYIAIYKSIGDKEIASEFLTQTGGSQTAAGFLAERTSKEAVRGQAAARLNKELYAAGKAANIIPGEGSEGGERAGKDTVLDNLLNRLKFIRKASIDAEGGIKELLKITSGKGLTVFGGVMQQLMAGPKGGFNREFISFLEQMDNKTRATYMTVKNGQVILTKQGKALKEAFNEKVIGEYQVANKQVLQDTKAQGAALLKLQASGVDSATALEMVADANLAVAINSKNITSKELRKMARDAQAAKDEVRKLNEEVLILAEDLKLKVKDAGDAMLAIAKAREAGITDPEMLKRISQNQALVTEIVDNGMSKKAEGIIESWKALDKFGTGIEGLIDPAKAAMDAFDKLRDAANKIFDRQTQEAQNDFENSMKRLAGTIAKLPAAFENLTIEDAIEKANEDIETLQAEIAKIEYDKIRPIDIEIEANEASINAFKKKLETVASKLKLKDGSLLPDAAYDDVRQKLEDKISEAELDLEFNSKYGERFVEQLKDNVSKIELEIELNFSRPIAELQEESSDLANDLTLMDKIADQVNSKYDAQAEALQKVSDINQEILNQQKGQLDIADALTRGDVSAAARAIQESRAQAAAAAAQRSVGALESARQAELGGIRSAGGMTRKQIEERQFQISQQIYNLEEQSEIRQRAILNIQDQIRGIEEIRTQKQREIRDIQDSLNAGDRARDKFIRENILPLENNIKDLQEKRQGFVNDIAVKEAAIAKIQNEILVPLEAEVKKREKILKDRLAAIDAEKLAWDNAQLALEKATTTATGFAGQATNAQKAFEAAKKAYDDINSKDIVIRIKKIVEETTVKNPGGGSDDKISAQAQMYGGKIKPMMYGGKAKAMSYGGRVGSDFVPAMLTPGEFVVNKGATKAFEPFLNAINESKYPSMIGGNMSSPQYSISAPVSNNLMPISNNSASITDSSSTVYNYNVGINVSGTNIDPKNIAKEVMNQIKYVDSQRIRTQRA